MKHFGEYIPKKLQATEEGIWYGSIQQEGTITDIIKSMDERYIGKLFIQDGKLVANKMTVTAEEQEWLDEVGVELVYSIDIGRIDITPNTKEFVNTDVEVQISYTRDIPEGYVIEYNLKKVVNGETIVIKDWTTYSDNEILIIEENNTKITARLYNKDTKDEAVSNAIEIANIDKDAPTEPTSVSITVGTNSVTATATGSTDTLSGFSKYQYSLDNSEWQDSGTFSGLNAGTEYTVYARAVDKSGNVSTSTSNSAITDKLTGSLVLSETSGTITYPTAGTFTVETNASGGTLSVSSSNTDVATVSISGTTITVTPGTTAGTATITVTSAATTSYTEASATYTATVKNGTLSVTASGYSGTYDGSAHGISVSCDGATIKYGTTSGSYTLTSSPTYTTAGTYTVYYEVSKTGYTTVTGSKQVVINKASGSVTLSATSGTICVSKSTTFTVKTNTSGGTLSVSSSSTTYATASISGTTVTITGKTTAGTATITVTSAATTNYNAASATYTVTVAAHSATTGGSLKSPATCTSAAVYYHKCSRCGTKLTSTYTSGSALGHYCSSPNYAYNTTYHIYGYCDRCRREMTSATTAGNTKHTYSTTSVAWTVNVGDNEGSSYQESGYTCMRVRASASWNYENCWFEVTTDSTTNATTKTVSCDKAGLSGSYYFGQETTYNKFANWATSSCNNATSVSISSGSGKKIVHVYVCLNSYTSNYCIFKIKNMVKHQCTGCGYKYYD